MSKIILDNGGGITLQLGAFAHCYDTADQAATDLAAWLADGDTSGWDGHEEDAAGLAPSGEQIRNGGYRWIRLDRDTDTIASLVADLLGTANGWINGEELADALAGKVVV